ncbi:MAG: trypsin-like peptidase domain-containing protein [Hyphomonas sp.]
MVNVYSQKTVKTGPSSMEMFLYGRSWPQSRVQNSLGSGVVGRVDGVIITNNHVVEGADSFRVVLHDRRDFAELVLADERTRPCRSQDRHGRRPLPVFLPHADTCASQVGDLVLAIGNPFGVGQTVTSGIISATARTDVGISDYSFFVQTDAVVNPGNSGGALINMKGNWSA